MKKNWILGMFSLALAACGGGGGDASPAPASATPPGVVPPAQDSQPPSLASDERELATRLYKGDARTPPDFDVEERPASVVGPVTTRHLRNTDLATGPQAAGPVFEVCTNDMAQAIAWSETNATWQGQYSDLVDVGADERKFEMVRVPRADVTAMLRHRVFRCDYLDRAGSDLRDEDGAAGSINLRPLTADELESLAEYLWQFTAFNNADYAVVASTRSANAGMPAHTIRIGQLERGANGVCDTVRLLDWTHTMDPDTGALTRSLDEVGSFRTRHTAAGAEPCAG